MAGKQTLSGQVAEEYCSRFPHATSKTLALRIMREAPSVYTSVDAARMAVMRARRSMKNEDSPGIYTAGKSGYPFGDLPDPIEQIRDASAYPTKSERVLILSDVHIPYHDGNALKQALMFGLDRDADCLILNGDFMDCHSLSRYEKDPRERDFPREIDATKQALRSIRKAFPRAEIIFKDGNHEERWQSYMYLKAPELLGMSDIFMLPNVLGLEDLGITRLSRATHVKIANLNVIHGHEFGGGGGVNPARWLYLRAHKNAICGHFHRTSEHVESDMEGSMTSCYSMGGLCQMRQWYSVYNKWNLGFAYVESDGDEDFRVHNLRIVHGKPT